jgi:diacylglycerol kinase (ATP)
MIKIGIICNPRSQQNKRDTSALKAFTDGKPDLVYARLEGVEDLAGILADFARKEVGVIAVSGGDGTVQATLTALTTAKRPFAELPAIAVLPHGMTNMTASDIGVSGRGAKGLARLLARAEDGGLEASMEERHLLRMENAKDTPPQVGMFFGGAGIYRAIQVCHNTIHPLKVEAELANGLTLAALVGRYLLRGGREDEVVRGDDIAVEIDGEGQGTASYLVVLATTLDRLVLGSRPFWNAAAGDFRYTAIGFPPRRLFCRLPKLLYGGAERRFADESYFSRGAREVTLTMDCPFTLDGQLFEADPERPLRLTAPETARFVKI